MTKRSHGFCGQQIQNLRKSPCARVSTIETGRETLARGHQLSMGQGTFTGGNQPNPATDTFENYWPPAPTRATAFLSKKTFSLDGRRAVSVPVGGGVEAVNVTSRRECGGSAADTALG